MPSKTMTARSTTELLNILTRRAVCICLLLVWPLTSISLAEGELADTHPVPANHLRFVTWNLEVFNQRNTNPFHKGNPNGPRTPAQLNKLAKRIIGLKAAIISLQEMNDVPALYDLRDRMNGGKEAKGPWQVQAISDSTTRQQNALLWDDTKVALVNAGFAFSTPSAGMYPHEFAYRSPVTCLFSPKGNPERKFRMIGIHGSWQTEDFRKDQGRWLSAYIADLLKDPNQPREIILAGDMNGTNAPGDEPHEGIISGGHMFYIPKRNKDDTAIGGPSIDSFYLTESARKKLTDPTSFVVRNDFYGESETEFRLVCSDHFPVFIDYFVGE